MPPTGYAISISGGPRCVLALGQRRRASWTSCRGFRCSAFPMRHWTSGALGPWARARAAGGEV